MKTPKRRAYTPFGRDFYPRAGRPDVAAELDFDRPCGHCGYNQRGLRASEACPECGSVGGLNPTDETIAWDQHRGVGAFFSTLFTVLFFPHTFAKLVWSPMRFDAAAGRMFRRIAVALSGASLTGVIYMITARTAGHPAALGALVFDAAAVFLWVNSASLDAIAFIKATGSPAARRAEILANYTSAALCLAPLHLVLLPLTMRLVEVAQPGWLVVAGIHLLALLAQIWIGAISAAWMFFELVDITPTRAIGLTLGRSMIPVASAAPLLLGVPALAGNVAWHCFGR